MLFLKNIAVENTLARYKAKFSKNSDGKGYLFFSEDYGSGLPCSEAQYESYINEFEALIEQKVRFMWWWFLLMIILALIAMGGVAYYMGIEILHPYQKYLGSLGGIFMILPLSFIFKEIWDYGKKTEKELAILGEISRERHSKEEIMNRRFRGMSYNMIILGIFISSLGLYIDIYEIEGGYDSPYIKYLFIGGIVMFLWFFVKKYTAEQKNKKV